MEYYLAIYSSITLANRVKKELGNTGRHLSVIRTPSLISQGGCSYALRFKKNLLDKIKDLSMILGINIKRIYIETSYDGGKAYLKVKGVDNIDIS